MDSSTVRVTSQVLWGASAVTLLVDLPLLAVVGRSVSSELFARLAWYLAAAAFLVYAALWGAFGTIFYWDAVYSHLFPAWSRWWLPVFYGTLFGVLALVFWRVSLRARRWPAAWFAVLGGLFSLVGHGIGIWRGLMRVPMLADASATSALVFGVFEFVFYWCAIVGLAVGARRACRATPPRGAS